MTKQEYFEKFLDDPKVAKSFDEYDGSKESVLDLFTTLTDHIIRQGLHQWRAQEDYDEFTVERNSAFFAWLYENGVDIFAYPELFKDNADEDFISYIPYSYNMAISEAKNANFD